MSALKTFLRELRYYPAVQALIPVDTCMGIPLSLEENMLYIPFFRPAGRNKCFLDSELYIGFPSGEIYEYRRIKGKICFEFDEEEMKKRKNDLFSGKTGFKDYRDMPEGLASIYQRAMEDRKNDEYPFSI